MKGHRTDWEDGYEGTHKRTEKTAIRQGKTEMKGTQNGLGRRQWRGPGRTEKTAIKGHRMDWTGKTAMKGHRRTGKTTMKGHRMDWEDGYEGTQNGLGRRL